MLADRRLTGRYWNGAMGMLDSVTAFVSATLTAFALFNATHIEPSAGVWVAAVAGGVLSSMTGKDRRAWRIVVSFATAICVGVASSQLLGEFFEHRNPNARVAEAFFCSLFAEKIVASVYDGSLLKTILARKVGK